ncbi:MAG: hypothetical protein AAF802_13865, partial [Planctomycetota bacterium]
MRLRSLLASAVLLSMASPASSQESDQNAASQPSPVKINIDLNSKDLETELRKAELQLRLRELELNAADGKKLIEVSRESIKSFEAKQAALESAVMAAEKEHEIAQQVSKKGLMSTQEL